MDTKTILSHVDHTLLKPEATWEQIKTLCDEAMEFGCATVCIPPAYVKQAADYVQGNLKICTVIGFPNGYNTMAAKIFETKDAVENGASEIDMVINIGWVKDRKWKELAEEIKEARSHGDLSENSEYDEAKNTQGLVENRITELEQMVKNARVIDESELSVDSVSVGTHVTIQLEDEDPEEYDIVAAPRLTP